jgi:REP element-mobilizing transposase RayT
LLLLGAHSATTLLVHVVWATHRRAPWLDPSLDRRLADLLEIAARRVECTQLAAGNAADHVHVLVRHPPSVAIATLVQRLKGTSARSLSAALGREAGHVWQVGYWAQTVSPSEFRAVAAYVANQRAHHDEPHAAREPWEPAASPPEGRASTVTGCDEVHLVPRALARGNW